MSDTSQSLSHSRWNGKYHVVFVPKRRRKALVGTIRKALGPIFHEVARQQEWRIIAGHVMPDHVHLCIEIPPTHAVASVIGFLTGKSAIAIARQFGGAGPFTDDWIGPSPWLSTHRDGRTLVDLIRKQVPSSVTPLA